MNLPPASFRRVGVIRAVIRLVATDDGRHLWAETFNGTSNDVLEFHAGIVTCVLEAARIAIMTAEFATAQRKLVEALQERDLMLKALPLALTPGRNTHALEALYRAMERHPDSGLAAARAAWCHAQAVTPWNENSDNDKSRALALAERAGVLDPADPLVLTARAAVITMAQDFDTADMLVRHALARATLDAIVRGNGEVGSGP
jgi:Flp pilus assembly protein TadD